MKTCFMLMLLVFSVGLLQAQEKDYELKVISKQYQNVRGKLQKISPEGLAIEDYKGNYLIFRAADIVKLKIRKRGLTVGEAAGTGTLTGLGISAGLWSLDQENQSFAEMAKLTGIITTSGAVIGVITGIVAELINTKLTLTIDGNEEKFRKQYQKLAPYINLVHTEHFN